MANVLVVESNPAQFGDVGAVLRQAGHAVVVAEDGLDGLAAVRTSLPDVVLTNMHLPRMNGLELIRAVRAEYPTLPVILTTDQGSEELAVTALRAGAASYIPRRNVARDMVSTLEDVLAVAASQRKRSWFLGRLTAMEYRFELENDPELVPQVVGHVEAMVQQVGVFDPGDRMQLGVAVHEAVVNAIVHGNLEVSSDLKEGDWQAYLDAVVDRAARDPYRHRRVIVTIRVDRGPYLEVRVRDQGQGFDPSKLPDPTKPANRMRASGRGLLLIRTFFDRVSHNASGTEIVMIKGRAAESPTGTRGTECGSVS